MKHNMSKFALCPFYKHEDSQVIYCEGVQDNSVLHIAFANKRDAKAYKIKFCREHYARCPIYKLLEGLYDEKS